MPDNIEHPVGANKTIKPEDVVKALRCGHPSDTCINKQCMYHRADFGKGCSVRKINYDAADLITSLAARVAEPEAAEHQLDMANAVRGYNVSGYVALAQYIRELKSLLTEIDGWYTGAFPVVMRINGKDIYTPGLPFYEPGTGIVLANSEDEEEQQ